jgi:hypothetical protein
MNTTRSCSTGAVVVDGTAVVVSTAVGDVAVVGGELVITDVPPDDVVLSNPSGRSPVSDVLDPQPATINTRAKVAVFLMIPVSPPSNAWLSASSER